MKLRYDFSRGEREKFHRPGDLFRLFICLDETVERYFSARAEAKGVDLSDLVNDLFKNDIELIEVGR